MSSTPDLLDDFVHSRLHATPFPDDRDHADVFRTSEHQLNEVIHGGAHVVAGWQDPGTVDVTLWIAHEFRGWARRALEDKLRVSRLIIMTVLPTEEYESGSNVIWWAYPVECMSCGEELPAEHRQRGLCDGCVEIRGNVSELFPEHAHPGIEQSRGLHGAPLPRRRPSGG